MITNDEAKRTALAKVNSICFHFQSKVEIDYRDERSQASELPENLEVSSPKLQINGRREPLSQLLWGVTNLFCLKHPVRLPHRGKQLSAGGCPSAGPRLPSSSCFHHSLLPACTLSSSPCWPCSVGQPSGALKFPPVSTKHALFFQSFLTHHGCLTKRDTPFPLLSFMTNLIPQCIRQFSSRYTRRWHSVPRRPCPRVSSFLSLSNVTHHILKT